MIVKLASLLIILASVLVISSASHAFAGTNPYVTGYPNNSTITIHSQYTLQSSFDHVAGSRTTNLGQVFSSAGFQSTSSTDPTGWNYQHVIDLHTDNYIYGEEQVWNIDGCKWHCNVDTSKEQLGHYGTASTDINYVYSTYYWSGSPHNTVNFYFESHFRNGTVTSAPLVQYSTATYSDPSQYFATGLKSKTFGLNTYKFKLFQFGVESQNSAVSTAWNATEYTMTYKGGTQSYNSETTAATSPSTQTDYSNNTWMAYLTNSSGTYVSQIGDTQYSANAYSHHNHSSVPSGTVIWYESGTPITRGTQLWP